MGIEKDILLLVLGALISIFPMIILKFVDNWIDKKGEVRVYKKVVYSDINNEAWGFIDIDSKTVLMVTMWIEIVNTKKVPTVIRDFNVSAYSKGKQCINLKQITHKKDFSHYGDQGRYSFLIEAQSISRYTLLFMLHKEDYPKEFDELRIVYYDENNKKQISKFKNIEKSWQISNNEIDEEWTLV